MTGAGRRGHRFRVAAALTALVALSAAAACGTAEGSGAPAGGDRGPSTSSAPDVAVVVDDAVPELPVTVDSADGQRVTVESTERILPLSGNNAEVVFALGLGDRVVGRDVSTTFAAAADLPLVTRAHDVSAEAVLSLEPTVVLATTETGPPEALEQIRGAGVPVVVVEEPRSVEQIESHTTAVAAALGVPEAGAELYAHTRAELEEVTATIPPGTDPPEVAFLYLRGAAGVYLLGGEGSGADSMIRAAGAVDAGTEAGLGAFTPLTSEALVEMAPDVLLVMADGLDSVGGVEGLLAMPGIAQTPAGTDGRIITIDDGILYSFGPRAPRALAELIEEIHGGSDSDHGERAGGAG